MAGTCPAPEMRPRRRLQSRDSAEVRGHSNRSTAVASDSTRRKEGRNRRCLATAGSSRSPRWVPRIRRAAGDVVVGLVTPEEFGRIGFADQDRAGVSQAAHDGRVVTCGQVLEEAAAARRRQSLHIETVFYGDRDAMQRSQRFAIHDSLLGDDGGFARVVIEHDDEGVDGGVVALDLRQVCASSNSTGERSLLPDPLGHGSERQVDRHFPSVALSLF